MLGSNLVRRRENGKEERVNVEMNIGII